MMVDHYCQGGWLSNKTPRKIIRERARKIAHNSAVKIEASTGREVRGYNERMENSRVTKCIRWGV